MYSRTGEDERVAAILDDLGVKKPKCVDIGCGYHNCWSNTRLFAERGSDVLRIDGGEAECHSWTDQGMPVVRGIVTPENVREMLRGYEDCDYLSVDIDTYDGPLLETILTFAKPHVIVAEVNLLFPPPVDFWVKYKPGLVWDHSSFFGQSISHLANIDERYGLHSMAQDNGILVIGPPHTSVAFEYFEALKQFSSDKDGHPGNRQFLDRHGAGTKEFFAEIEKLFSPRVRGIDYVIA